LPLSVLEWALGSRPIWRAGSLAAFAYVAIFPSLIAYILFNRAVGLIGAAHAGQLINMTPLFGAGMAILLLGEPVAMYHLFGMGLIVAGMALFANASPEGRTSA
jgi:drug/metabolite transporter (DMT)-like permease